MSPVHWVGLLKFTGIATFVELFIVPWAIKLLKGLGFGFVVMAGVYTIYDQLITTIQQNLGGIPGDVYKVMALAGFVDAVGIWLGALVTVAGILSFKRIGLIK